MNVFHHILRQSLGLLLTTLLFISGAQAIDLATAKAQGLVGERNDGYLGYVSHPVSAEVEALLKSVNTQRKAIFEKTAQKNNIATQQVAHRFYVRAVTATQAGHYYQNAQGEWIKK